MDCARNIITANFSGGGTSATTAALWQWDYGQVLCITGIEDLPAAFEVHFSTNRTGGVSTVTVGADGQVTIPNVLLTIGKNLNAWIYLSDSEGEGETEYSILIPVKARPMPETYDAEATGEFDDVVRQVSEYAQTAQTAADNAGASATAAAGSASAAAASASSAAGSAAAAEQAKDDAVTAKGQAETAAQTATQKAQQSAQDAEQAASDAGRAESAAQRAETAQTGAEAAKTAAETAAQNAAASASAASASATSAGQAASAAAQSASAAAQSAASIEGDVQTATQKASEATTAAGQAVTAKDAAVTAQTAAETAATNAGQSASTATTKAAEAAQSASNAAASETAAEAAATRAEQAAASLVVDDALSDTSENPVQNKVITESVTQLKSQINNTSQVVYKTEISASTGLIPFHVKNGDVITIKTKDGANFVGNDQLRFYDASGSMTEYISTAPQTVNHRTRTYTNASEAFYIGITQVAQSVITYIVENSSNAYNFGPSIENMQNAIKLQETKKIKLESGTFADATGTIKTENVARCRNNIPIPIADLVSIEMPDGYSMYTFLLDYNLQKIGVLTWSTYRPRIDMGDAVYINIAIRNTSSPSSSLVDSISTIESGVAITNGFSQLQSQVEGIENDLYEQTVILTDSSLHAFSVSNGTDFIITTTDGTTLPEGNPYLQCFDSSGTYLQQFLCSSDYGTERTVTVSAGDVAFVKMYTSPSKAIKVYVPDNSKLIPMVEEIANMIGQDVIIVAADGSGDYTSFTLAVKENYNNNKPITVMPGTYDIVSEYVAIWGQSAVDSMADVDSAIFDGWQYGVRMGGKKFTFMPGAHLVCDWTGHTVNGTHRFSALRVETDVEIIGLDLDCTATFYAIHDDYGTSDPYTVKYENCRVIGHNLVNADCIGGGCKKYSRHILKNCYFDNNLTNSATVRYHNTNAEGAEPEIYVSNCYFNNWFTPRWYGTQTSKMRVYVNNCEARSIHKLAESSSYNVDNVELYKWCNTETAPVT